MGEFRKTSIRICTCLICLNYILFLYLDISTKDLGNKYSLYLKYSVILICFLITLFIGKDGFAGWDRFLIQAARFFTLIADYLMVIKNENKLGIITFCIVQFIYIIRHTEDSCRRISTASLVKLVFVIGALMIFLAKFSSKGNELMFLGLIYASFLLTSLFCAIKVYNKKSYNVLESKIIAIGMTLFFLCDMNVAIYALTSKYIFGLLIWIFYAPSQLLLALSGFRSNSLNRIFSIKDKNKFFFSYYYCKNKRKGY